MSSSAAAATRSHLKRPTTGQNLFAPERQYLGHRVDRDVVMKDLERELVRNRSGDRQLPNSGRAVEEHETRRWPRVQVCDANGTDVGQCSGMTPELVVGCGGIPSGVG